MKVLFIFDRVMHYHVDLFQQLEMLLAKNDIELILLAGNPRKSTGGRDGIKDNIIKNQYIYNFYEIKVKRYILRIQFGILNVIFKQKPDIVVQQGHVGNITIWLLGALKKLFKYKLISWQCGYEYNDTQLKYIFTKIFLKNFDFHLAYHTNAMKYLINYKIDKKIIKIIYNTINEKKINILDKNKAREILYLKYPQAINKKIILYVGAILQEKKLELLIESFNLINEKESVLIIVGSGEHLEYLMRTYRLNENIIFTGKVLKGVEVYFDSAELFVLPGTGGLAINEAIYHGLPVISGYADGSADDLVIHNVNGYRLQNYTIEELANYINKLLKDENLRIMMSQNSRKIYLEKFTFNSFINNVYEGLILSCNCN